MSIKDNRLLKVVAAGAAAVMILGLAAAVTSAQRGPGGRQEWQDPGGPGGGFGRGMMGGPGMGGPGMRGGRGGPGGPLGLLGPEMRALELTDAQRELIRGVLASHQDASDAIGQEMAEARRGLHLTITADAENPDAIAAAVQAVSAVELKAALLQAQVHREVFAQLTPEQQQKAKELKADAEKRMKERTERMRERRKQVQDAMTIGDPGLV